MKTVTFAIGEYVEFIKSICGNMELNVGIYRKDRGKKGWFIYATKA